MIHCVFYYYEMLEKHSFTIFNVESIMYYSKKLTVILNEKRLGVEGIT